jgi:monoamine oxidase
MKNTDVTTLHSTQTLIIGAGMAGLVAAQLLALAGQAVTVLECRDRVGGRVFTHRHSLPNRVGSAIIEHGAEFIHGDQSLTWDLVRALGLASVQVNGPDDSLVRLLDGALLSINFDSNHLPDLRGLTPLEWTNPDPNDEPLDLYLVRMGVKPVQLEYEPRIFIIDNGGSLSHTSALATLEELDDESTGSGDYLLPGGYDALPLALAQGLDIRLNHAAHQVRWTQTGVEVVTADGGHWQAENLIITVPLGVLQQRGLEFVPDLPAQRWQDIDALAMAPMFKLIYHFEGPVLPPGIANFYTRSNPALFWTTSHLRGMNTDTILCAFVTGDWARELAVLDDAARLHLGLSVLRAELRRPELQPLFAEVCDWSRDPASRGGYSYTPPGALPSRTRLAEPLGPLVFAGEAAARAAAQGSVHGAVESGRRAAELLLAKQQQTADWPGLLAQLRGMAGRS